MHQRHTAAGLFFSQAGCPSEICNIEWCDITAVVIIFPIKAEHKILLSEVETFDSSISKA